MVGMASASESAGNIAFDIDGSIIDSGGAEIFPGLAFPAPGDLEYPCNGFNGTLYGQCTAWVCFRSNQLGHPIIQPAGDGGQVATTLINRGWKRSLVPVNGAVVSFYATDGGHVAIVEEVLADGSWITSDMNVSGNRTNVYKITHSKDCFNCIFALWHEALEVG
jgi:hypothetical protein